MEFPGIAFMARPVVGGHFAFLALERACGGKAIEALRFLDEETPAAVDIEQALLADAPESSAGDTAGQLFLRRRPLRPDIQSY